MTTIKDVAKRAGVSVAAVSKVLNGYPDIGEDTRKRVLEIVEELRYYPRSSARRMVTKTSRLIGLYYKSIAGMGIKQPFIAHVINHFQEYIGGYGYDLVLFSESYSPIYDWKLVDRVRHQEVDGLLLIGDVEVDLELLMTLDIPIVGLDVPVAGKRCAWVTSNNCGGVRDAVLSLFKGGYQKIGFMYGPLDQRPAADRLKGYQLGMQELGLPIREEWVQFGGYDLDRGVLAARQFHQLADRPEVIICSSDVSAIGAMQFFQDVGIDVPKDIGLVGFDDIDVASFIKPRLTSIAQNKEAMSRAAAQLMHTLMDDRDGGKTLRRVSEIPTKLVIRESTRPMHGGTVQSSKHPVGRGYPSDYFGIVREK